MSVVLKKSGGVIMSQGHDPTPTKEHISVTVEGALTVDDAGKWFLSYGDLDPQEMVKKRFAHGDRVKITINIVKEL